jgi:hypothetical protein
MAEVEPPAELASDPLWDGWETPPRLPASPVLHLEGFDGPMDVLLDLAERQRIDFGRMSILELAEQFVAAMARLADRVTLEQRADWLVLATRLVLLRSRLLFPDSPESAAAAEQDAAAELRRLDDLAAMRAAGVWLQQRPQLGLDVFVRRPTAVPREGGYIALMEACLVVLRAGKGDRRRRRCTGPPFRISGAWWMPWRGSRHCSPSTRRAATSPPSCRSLPRRRWTARFAHGQRWQAPFWRGLSSRAKAH